MRDVLCNAKMGKVYIPSEHMGLAYVMYAPIQADGELDENERDKWFGKLEEQYNVPVDYEIAYKRWCKSLSLDESMAAEGTVGTRLFVGHGEASPTEVGLTFHHTWGVPVIPGSALKGLLAHYVETVYGPTDPANHEGEAERAPWRGVLRDEKGKKILAGPGEAYKVLFGAPDAIQDQGSEGAAAGSVIFHDAWMIPDEIQRNPFVRDIITPHQSEYYKTGGETPANDYENPVPVAFLNVRPGTRFLIALSGPAAWTKLALDLLRKALMEWGVGAKTAAGYGRFSSVPEDWNDKVLEEIRELVRAEEQRQAVAEAGESQIVKDIEDWFGSAEVIAMTNNARMADFDALWTERIQEEAVDAVMKEAIWKSISSSVPKNKKTRDWWERWKADLGR